MFSIKRRALVSTKWVTLIAGVSLAGNSAALAASGIDWNCNTANGHYDSRDLPIPPHSRIISGQIVVHKADFRPDWNSLAKISFKQNVPGDGNCHCSGMEVVAFRNPDKVEVHVVANGIDQAMAQTTFEDTINFRISIDDRGAMTVDLGKIEHMKKSVDLTHPGHDALAMSCSGLDLSFMNIVVE